MFTLEYLSGQITVLTCPRAESLMRSGVFLAVSGRVSKVNGCYRDQRWELGAADALEVATSVFDIAQI